MTAKKKQLWTIRCQYDCLNNATKLVQYNLPIDGWTTYAVCEKHGVSSWDNCREMPRGKQKVQPCDGYLEFIGEYDPVHEDSFEHKIFVCDRFKYHNPPHKRTGFDDYAQEFRLEWWNSK